MGPRRPLFVSSFPSPFTWLRSVVGSELWIDERLSFIVPSYTAAVLQGRLGLILATALPSAIDLSSKGSSTETNGANEVPYEKASYTLTLSLQAASLDRVV